MVLLCISLIISGDEHLFIYLLALYITSLERYLFKFFDCFLIRLFDFLLMSYRHSLYILHLFINLLSDIWFANIFSSSVSCIFTLLIISFAAQKGIYYFYLFIYFAFLGLHPQHMEVPVLGAEWNLYLLAYATATATWDPSHVCDLHHSSQQSQILSPLSKARDQTHVIMDTSQVRYH